MKTLFYINFRGLICMIACFLVVISSKGQVILENDFSDFEKYQIGNSVPKPDYDEIKQTSNTYGLVFTGLFLFYKKFMSSQDSGNCPFHISCSEYFIKSVHYKGVFTGVLNGMDRYTRCNGFNMEIYKLNHKTHRFDDPLVWEN